MHIESPEFLKKVPQQVYSEIKRIAKIRYQYDLPEAQTKLTCLKSPTSKINLLRDLCKKSGIQINSQKDYIFDNDPKILEAKVTSLLLSKQSSKKSKQMQIDPQQMKSYECLPFQSQDILAIYPTLKTLDIHNADVRTGLHSAK